MSSRLQNKGTVGLRAEPDPKIYSHMMTCLRGGSYLFVGFFLQNVTHVRDVYQVTLSPLSDLYGFIIYVLYLLGSCFKLCLLAFFEFSAKIRCHSMSYNVIKCLTLGNVKCHKLLFLFIYMSYLCTPINSLNEPPLAHLGKIQVKSFWHFYPCRKT